MKGWEARDGNGAWVRCRDGEGRDGSEARVR